MDVEKWQRVYLQVICGKNIYIFVPRHVSIVTTIMGEWCKCGELRDNLVYFIKHDSHNASGVSTFQKTFHGLPLMLSNCCVKSATEV